MTLATEVKKFRDSKAYYAVAGAGDLAREKLREVPGRLRDLQEKTDPKDIPGVALSYATQAGAKASELIDELAERGRGVVRPEAPAPGELEGTPTKPKSE
ncbi:MAG TPA: hypothetical protein VGL93_25375 [Streptosporangiaceae bacterium]|jgi:hypothetical protein